MTNTRTRLIMNPAQLFAHCGQYLCGDGPRWKEQFATMLAVSTNTVDNMAKGDSRVPPPMWLEIAGLIQDRERELPALRDEVLKATAPDYNLLKTVEASMRDRKSGRPVR
jgi:hypothetical protein